MDILYLIAGIVCAALGGELFVRGTLGVSAVLRFAPGVVAATLAAFATSAPELSVSTMAALDKHTALGVGDALGSNVANIALVGGLALVLGASIDRTTASKRYITTALYAPLITAGVLYDGSLSRLEALVLLSIFLIWLILTVRDARRDRSSITLEEQGAPLWKSIFNVASGTALLALAGILVATSAPGIASSLGVSDFVIGATIVAIGTSVPEIAVVIIARFRQMDDIGLGTLIGSNLFNGLFIIPLASLIWPPEVDFQSAAIALAFGFLAVLVVSVPERILVLRTRGLVLLVLYVIHLFVVSAA